MQARLANAIGPAIAPATLPPRPRRPRVAAAPASTKRTAPSSALLRTQFSSQRSDSSTTLTVLDARSPNRKAGAQLSCRRHLVGCSTANGGASSGDGPPQLEQQRKATQLERFAGFVAAGDAKEAWLCISASVLRLAVPSALLATALHGSLWGGTPPALATLAEAAAWGGAIIAGGTEVWKILEGFRG